MRPFLSFLAATVVLISGCGDKQEPAPAPAPAPTPAPKPVSMAPPVPDVGKVESVKVTADGFGASAQEAVSEAMKMAILQVNGASLQTASMTAQYGLDVTFGKNAASLRANEFVDVVKQRSGGVIQNFKVLDLQEPVPIVRDRYKATIEADIAKFTVSADMKKLKIVVAPVRFAQARLPMGDRSVPAAEVGAMLRDRISNALVQTGRFAVLDRQSSPEIDNELDMIANGQAPAAETAKLSQAASADIIWIGSVSNLAYNRYARQLKSSDRELVSYSGGWAMSQKLVTVATRQVMASDSFSGEAPSTAPTTMGAGVNADKVLETMANALVEQTVASILQRSFPVTVVSRDGTNVVLSQGGQALRAGSRYAIATMGAEMTDPQTGQSLGRTESSCCELVVERVTANLSYGRLENVRSDLDRVPAGGLQLRGEIKGVASGNAVAVTPAVAATAGAPAAAAVPAARPKTPAARPAASESASASRPATVAPASGDADKW